MSEQCCLHIEGNSDQLPDLRPGEIVAMQGVVYEVYESGRSCARLKVLRARREGDAPVETTFGKGTIYNTTQAGA